MKTTFEHTSEDFTRVRLAENLGELLASLRTDIFCVGKVDGCEINLWDKTSNSLVTAHLKLPDEFSGIQNTYQGFHYPADKTNANAQVFFSTRAANITADNLADFGDTTRLRFERWKMRHLLVLPLPVPLADGRVRTIGTIAIFSQGELFDDDAIQRFEKLADLYAPQIQVHWSYQQAIERGRMVDVMYTEIQRFVTTITRMNSLTAVDEVYASIGREFIERFRFDLVNILLAEQGELVMVHTAFSDPFRHLAPKWEPFRTGTRYSLSVRDGQSSLIFQSNQRFFISDVMKVMHLPMAEKDRTGLEILQTPRTFMIVPIRLNEDVIGVMWLVSLDKPNDLPETDMTLIELLASFISTAIRNAQAHMTVELQNVKIEALNRELRSKIVLLDEIARKDRLTGLNNFGSFEEELRERTAECNRAVMETTLSVILLDIDHFKPFNDTHGHPAGNQVLQAVGARIVNAVRDVDFVARYGGEEFVVLLPDCDLDGAAQIAERIRQKVDADSIAIDGKDVRITISGGCTQFLRGETADTFIARADQALYAAKHNGRNRIEQALPMRQAPQQASGVNKMV